MLASVCLVGIIDLMACMYFSWRNAGLQNCTSESSSSRMYSSPWWDTTSSCYSCCRYFAKPIGYVPTAIPRGWLQRHHVRDLTVPMPRLLAGSHNLSARHRIISAPSCDWLWAWMSIVWSTHSTIDSVHIVVSSANCYAEKSVKLSSQQQGSLLGTPVGPSVVTTIYLLTSCSSCSRRTSKEHASVLLAAIQK
jgi:hypothetical protein